MLAWMSRRLVIALALLAGCRDKGIAQLEGIRDEICKCKTSKCGEEAMRRVPATDGPNNHRAQQIAREMMDCLAHLYDAERPGTGPDEDTDTAARAPTAPQPATP
jgi:hypothetical protein